MKMSNWLRVNSFNEKDEYYTPAILVKPIIKYIPKGSVVWCPFDTDDSEFVIGLKKAGIEVVYSHIWGGQDFFTYEPEHYDIIITNPPYRYAQEFVERAMELTGNKVAMFLKLTFLEGQRRKELFEKYPPQTVYVFSARKKCALNGEFATTGSSAAAYAWFVWQRGFTGDPIIKWI